MAERTLITASVDPDIDGVACAIGYTEYLTQTQSPHNSTRYNAKFQGTPHIEALFVLEQLGLTHSTLKDNETHSSFILVDACQMAGLPRCIILTKVEEVIDHRLFPEYESFPNARFRIEPVGAAATQIAEFYYFGNKEPSKQVADLLLCAIYSNTTNFLADTSTFRDERMRNWLLSVGANKDLPIQMLEHKTHYAEKHVQDILEKDKKKVALNGVETQVYQVELLDTNRFKKSKDLESFLSDKNDSYILIIQDMLNTKTYVHSRNLELLQTLAKSNKFANLEEFWLESKSIFMRKSILKMLYN